MVKYIGFHLYFIIILLKFEMTVEYIRKYSESKISILIQLYVRPSGHTSIFIFFILLNLKEANFVIYIESKIPSIRRYWINYMYGHNKVERKCLVIPYQNLWPIIVMSSYSKFPIFDFKKVEQLNKWYISGK